MLYGIGGAAFPFLIDALSYATSVVSLVFVRAPLQATGPFMTVLLLFIPQVILAILTTMNRRLR